MRLQQLTAWLLMGCVLMACSSPNRQEAPAVSFYYWKTKGALNAAEQKAVTRNKVSNLYVRYFDVDKDPSTGLTRPLSTIAMNTSFPGVPMIPVIYIKNRVFENADNNAINSLCENILEHIRFINSDNKKVTGEVQFDCDWTDRTREAYFHFLQIFKERSGWPLSATIRLHQVKYKQRTGIPPVDRGVLMFYNMGRIDAGAVNSVYDKSNALKYVSALKTYPLPLDIALPVFSWGIGIRGGKVQYLLNKMYPADFEKDSNFVQTSPNRFRAAHSFFKSGSYIREGDEVKLETVTEPALYEMAELLHTHLSQPLRTLIFYDLDSANLKQYEDDIFQKVSERFR